MNTFIAMALAAAIGMVPDADDVAKVRESFEIVEDFGYSKKAEKKEEKASAEAPAPEPEIEESSEQTGEISEISEEATDDGYSEEAVEEPAEEEPELYVYSAEELQYAGVIYDGTVTYTWYSESELSGEGLDIPGRHHELGFIMDGDGNICVASCDYSRGTPISVPFGYGRAIVYDYCPTSGIIDVYMP